MIELEKLQHLTDLEIKLPVDVNSQEFGILPNGYDDVHGNEHIEDAAQNRVTALFTQLRTRESPRMRKLTVTYGHKLEIRAWHFVVTEKSPSSGDLVVKKKYVGIAGLQSSYDPFVWGVWRWVVGPTSPPEQWELE